MKKSILLNLQWDTLPYDRILNTVNSIDRHETRKLNRVLYYNKVFYVSCYTYDLLPHQKKEVLNDWIRLLLKADFRKGPLQTMTACHGRVLERSWTVKVSAKSVQYSIYTSHVLYIYCEIF